MMSCNVNVLPVPAPPVRKKDSPSVASAGGESAAVAWHAARVHTCSHPRQLSARAHIMAPRDDACLVVDLLHRHCLLRIKKKEKRFIFIIDYVGDTCT